MRKAKAYILFYVERDEQVATDKSATNRSAEHTAAMDSVSSEVSAQDNSDEADGVATDADLMDVASSHTNTIDVTAPDDAALENEGEDMAALDDAGAASERDVADRDTSDKARTEETCQAIQTIAQ